MTHLKVGGKAPLFEGLNQNNDIVNLNNFTGKKLILYFYPKDNTPGCTAESCNLNENYDAWLNRGFEVVGVSPDSVLSHQKFVNKFALKFNLIADTEKEILQAYGVWGEKNMYGRKYMGVMRTTFVIDENGIIMDIFEKVQTKDHTNQIIKSLNI
ncbi:MAG: thioredoxin-dependent thiol peroxidase [Prolixibacteraceae bacterium]|jgi:thioredoxin-dependent peroxiredoxin|nr:thioredoxin-dependent thiol peroxidase [Prolixibacteraceae bacterium]MBT6005745.1 thioredoxin-dependent thiol peroxidase [Prolixibacteraceae bacterium]MBT6999959.1 thioredoxin-dependent thiol peroxidase [Prolixibacteraceae bacterium]MBT7396279.1 thioredoxin-dependent thiol peroxidase [Prolixibacteraceae bacterium]